MRLKCKDCGTVYAAGKDHTCKPVKPVVAVTIPELLAIDFQKFDKKTWQREYMHHCMPVKIDAVKETLSRNPLISKLVEKDAFDRKAYQREYMREWRKRDKARKAEK